MPLKGLLRGQTLPLFLFAFWPHLLPTMMFCLISGPKLTESADHGLKSYKTMSQNKHFLLSVDFPQVFYHRDES
jgi:hypothetical protein